jgi:hypothetical protein
MGGDASRGFRLSVLGRKHGGVAGSRDEAEGQARVWVGLLMRRMRGWTEVCPMGNILRIVD